MSDNITKFTSEEMQEIANLQAKYQQRIIELGQLQLEEIDLEQTKQELSQRKTSILDSWKTIQQEEQNLLNKLADKYGNGSLNLRDGTFKPAPDQPAQ